MVGMEFGSRVAGTEDFHLCFFHFTLIQFLLVTEE